jgi:hypothetical protein
MQGSPAELFRDWRDFYILVGTASATLVGLMFVAASIGTHIFNEGHRAPMGAFITPTVVHFSASLFASLIVIMPTSNWPVLAVLLGAGAFAGAIYAGTILTNIIIRRRFGVDMTDQMFYALIPVLGYLTMLAAAVLMLLPSPASVDLVAAGLLVLLFAGIRNAWDMMLWIVFRSPAAEEPAAVSEKT